MVHENLICAQAIQNEHQQNARLRNVKINYIVSLKSLNSVTKLYSQDHTELFTRFFSPVVVKL